MAKKSFTMLFMVKQEIYDVKNGNVNYYNFIDKDNNLELIWSSLCE